MIGSVQQTAGNRAAQALVYSRYPRNGNRDAAAWKMPEQVKHALSSQQGTALPSGDQWSDRIGSDVSHARLVTGPTAERAAGALGARAFTVGQRIFFGAGYGSSTDGGRLLRHELVHVAQQRGARLPGSLDALSVTSPRGLAETEAGRGTSASPTEAVVARDQAPDVDAATYADTFADEIGNGIRDFIAAQEFQLPSPFMTWAASVSFGASALASTGVSGSSALTARLPELIRPDEMSALIDRGRKKGTILVTDEKTTWAEEEPHKGPLTWFPDVAVEIGQVLAQHFLRSIERMVPRYLDARVAAATEQEARQRASIFEAPEPSTDSIIPSEPIDVLTIGALVSGGVLFDWAVYRAANPTATGHKGELRPLSIWLEQPQNGTFWVRVISPSDPTVEEVAFALFGSSTMTREIGVVAPPLFGFGSASRLRPGVRVVLVSIGVSITGTGEPAVEGMRGPLADEIALGQAKPVADADKGEVLETISKSLVILDRFAEIGAAFGMGKDPTLGNVTGTREQLLQKQHQLEAADDDTVRKWAGQVAEQKQILTQAAFGFAGLVERFQTMTKNVQDATEKLGGFNLPPSVREAMHRVAMRYVDAVNLSFFPSTAAERLDAAEEANRLLPVEFLEGTLAGIRRTVDDALADKREKGGEHVSYGVEGMREREISLRARLARIRTMVLSDPMAAGQMLEQIQKEILDLQTEAELVGNMDQLDLAWQSLDDSLSIWFSSTPTRMRVGLLKAEGDRWHARWKAIFDLWKKGDAASRDQAKKDLDQLRKDAALADYFGRLRAVIKDAQVEILIGKIVAMLVITIVTAGVGEFAIGFAAGAELSTGATLVAVSGAEAVTFTLLSQIFLDTNHSAGHIAWELATNWVMFAAMRRFALAAEAAKLSKVTSATVQAVLMGAMGLAKEEIEKYVKTGKHLTKEEISQIAVQSLITFVVQQRLSKFVEPILTGVRARGTMLGLRINAANRAGVGLKAMAKGLVGSRDVAKALEYIQAERTWLELQIKAYEQLEADARAEEKSGKPPKDGGVLKQAGIKMPDIKAMKAALGEHLATLTAARTMLTLDPIAPDVYSCPKGRIAEVLAELGGATSVTEDPVTKVKTYEAKGPDGRKIRIVEEVGQYVRWLEELKAELTDVEVAKLTKMSTRRTARQIHDQFKGNKELAIKNIRHELALDVVLSKMDPLGRTTFKQNVYVSIDPTSKTPAEGWKFDDTVEQEGGDVWVAKTKVVAPNNEEGMGERALNIRTGELEMREIKAPRGASWIKTETPMIEGKGTPTASYITMRLMRLLGIAPGTLKRVTVKNIWNVEAILQLRSLEAAGFSRDQGVARTSSVTSQEASIVQSGHAITGVKVIGGKEASLEEALTYWEKDQGKLDKPDPAIVARYDEILKRYGLTHEEAINGTFFWDYNIEITLSPMPKGVTPSTRAPIVVPVPARREEDKKKK
jgi:hypothetical protein